MNRKYGLKYRPAEPCTLPKGVVVVEIESHQAFNFGVVQFERDLTDEEVKNFELFPILTVEEHAKLLVQKMGKYAKRYNALNAIGFVQTHYGPVFSTNNVSELVAAVLREAEND